MKRIISLILSIAMILCVFITDGASIFGQIKDSVLNSFADLTNRIVDTQADCEHDYQFEKKAYTTEPTCTKKAYIINKCTICGSRQTVYAALGHYYVPFEFKYRSIEYQCKHCNAIVTESVDMPLSIFESNMNKTVVRNNNNCFIDIVTDGVINGKDYAYLKKMSKHELTNKNANAQTKAIYKYLCEINGSYTLSAQQESTWMGSVDYEINYINKSTGKKPAMRGLDYMNDDFKGVNKRAIAYAKSGGLVTICWHTGSDFCGEWNDAMNDVVEDWNAMLTVGTKEYNAMIAGMDKAASALLELQNAGVTVLWRPFHEFDGGWFWWGKNGAESFVKLWQIMYDRYTNYWGLNNLIWVLGYSHIGENLVQWNPGEQYYDIIGADSYDKPEIPNLYNSVKTLNIGNKPMALHECGENPTVEELNSYPWCYFMTWHTEYLTNSNSADALNTLYNSNKVITLDEISY